MRNLSLTKPPLGWNSFDCFDGSINEEHALKNLEVFIEKFKPAGYEYFVIDIAWYRVILDPKPNQYGLLQRKWKIGKIDWELDEWGRFLPSRQCFPNGFGPIINRCHEAGVKFGVHLMRGVPQKAVKEKLPIKGTNGITADQIANLDPRDVCPWSNICYGIDMTKPGAQEYYDSVIEQLAEMGVDFIKYDDIEGSAEEMEAVYKAIDKVDREITLSLSLFSYGYMKKQIPLSVYAKSNMMRITHDIWDKQEHIDSSFDAWLQRSLQDKDRPSWFFFDLDMIPFGHLRLNYGATADEEFTDTFNEEGEHWCHFTPAQMRTFMTQRAMMGSPLFLGSNLPDNDALTDSIVLNAGMLECDQNGVVGHPVTHEGDLHIFRTPGNEDPEGFGWIGIFNRGDGELQTEVSLEKLGLMEDQTYCFYDVWNQTELNCVKEFSINAHDVVFLKYIKKS